MSEQLHQAKDVYLDMCSRALFLASKAVTPQGGFDDLQAISIIKVSLEADHGAYLGAGLTRTLLEGFPEGERLGWGMIILNDDLGLHHSELAKWEKSYWVYGEHTAYGHLILAGTIDNFVRWAASMPCRKEVAGVRSGRLFAYIRHPNDPKFTHPGRGFIVYVDAQGGTAAATVANGYGYGIFASGSHYEGELKDNKKHGFGTQIWADGGKYTGQWKGNKKHGTGTFIWPDGSSYDGEWEDDLKHGWGTYNWPDGSAYVGLFQDDHYCGSGGAYARDECPEAADDDHDDSYDDGYFDAGLPPRLLRGF